MILYLIPLVIAFICAIEYDINGKKYGKGYWWSLLFVYMTLFMGLRYGVGGDTINYMRDYEWTPVISNYTIISLNRYDPGFNLLMSIGKTFSKEFVSFQILHILILNSLLFAIIKKFTRYWFSAFFFSLFVFYYYYSTEILRESLAVLCFVLNYNNLIKKKWLRYYFVIIICALLHRSALFLAVLPMFTGLRFNRKYMFILAGTFVSGIILNRFLSQLGSDNIISDGISRYSGEGSHGMLADLLRFSRLAVFPFLFAIYVKYYTKKAGDLKFENMLAIMIIFGTLAFYSPIIFSRLCNYFKVFFVLSFTTAFINLAKLKYQVIRRNVCIIFTVFVLIYGSEYLMYNYYTRLIPYYSVFNPVDVNRNSF
ncbi:MAG: EpsG family protein [Bacteroides sp.]|nr:EpsG family protein [Bacteroides sp.]